LRLGIPFGFNLIKKVVAKLRHIIIACVGHMLLELILMLGDGTGAWTILFLFGLCWFE